MNQTSKWRRLCAAVAALGLAVGIAGCYKAQAQPGAMPPPAVQVVPAQTANVPLYIDQIGQTTATEVVSLQSQVSGRIVRLGFHDGEPVSKGKVLVEIDQRPYQAALDQAKAQVKQNQAAIVLANQLFNRTKELLASKAVSQDEFDTRKNAVDVAQAQLDASNAAVEVAQTNLDYCTIKSPIDGLAGKRLIDEGNVVQTTMGQNTPLVILRSINPIYADFTVTERRLPEVQQYLKEGKAYALVWLPEETDAQSRHGEITFLDNSVQDASGTIQLRAKVQNKDRHFWPGQLVKVRLVLTVLEHAVLVPEQAVQTSQTGPFVYAVDHQGMAQFRPVKLGQRQGADVVILDGVSAGDNVVTVGQMMVQPGAPVTVVPGAPPSSQPATNPAFGQAAETQPAAAPGTQPMNSIQPERSDRTGSDRPGAGQ